MKDYQLMQKKKKQGASWIWLQNLFYQPSDILQIGIPIDEIVSERDIDSEWLKLMQGHWYKN